MIADRVRGAAGSPTGTGVHFRATDHVRFQTAEHLEPPPLSHIPPYIAIADVRRRFGLEPDAMSVVSRNGTTAYIGLPERESTKLQDLWQREEVGLELSVEVHAPVVVGIFPMRIARFVIDEATKGSSNGNGHHLHFEPIGTPLHEEVPVA